MTRQAVSTSAGAPVVGPYSQAIVPGGFVFCSGTAGIDPDTGEVREGVRAQTEQALTNLAAILQAAGTSMESVVKTTIFYTNVDGFATINETHARRMPDPPARTLRARQGRTTARTAGLDRSDRRSARHRLTPIRPASDKTPP